MNYQDVFKKDKTVIGMVHLLALPGHEKHTNMLDVKDAALYDAEALLKGGIKHAIVENDGDRPFGITKLGYDFSRIHDGMVTVGARIHEKFPELTLGVQVLNNYGKTPEIVEAIGGKFLRCQFYSETRIDTDGRTIMPCYKEIYKSNKEHGFVVLADINSKGSHPLTPHYCIEDSIKDLIDSEYKPDALIVTGTATGSAPVKEDVDDFVAKVKECDSEMRVGGGSGVTSKAITNGLIDNVDFVVVGSYLKEDGRNNKGKVIDVMETLQETYGYTY